MLSAFTIALAASAAIHIGKVIQRQGVKVLPRFSLDRVTLRAFLKSKTYIFGLLLDIVGGILSAVALSQAPVSVIQPVISSGLVFVALYSHFALRERLTGKEWAAVVLAVGGLALVGITANGEDQTVLNPRKLWPGAALAAYLLMPSGVPIKFSNTTMPVSEKHASTMASPSKEPLAPGQHSHGKLSTLVFLRPLSTALGGRMHRLIHQSSMLGIKAGACFGLSGVVMRVAFLLLPRGVQYTAASVGLSLLLTSRGVLFQARSFKAGPNSAVSLITIAAGGSMLISVLCGIVLLGEPVAASWAGAATRLGGWLLLGLGVLGMGGQGAAEKQGGGAKAHPLEHKV